MGRDPRGVSGQVARALKPQMMVASGRMVVEKGGKKLGFGISHPLESKWVTKEVNQSLRPDHA